MARGPTASAVFKVIFQLPRWFTDKGLTEQLEAKLEGEARMRQTGLIDPEIEQLDVNKALPLEDHVQVFARNLADNSDDYVDLILSRIRRTIRDGKFETFVELHAGPSAGLPLGAPEERGLEQPDVNHYVQALHTSATGASDSSRTRFWG